MYGNITCCIPIRCTRKYQVGKGILFGVHEIQDILVVLCHFHALLKRETKEFCNPMFAIRSISLHTNADLHSKSIILENNKVHYENMMQHKDCIIWNFYSVKSSFTEFLLGKYTCMWDFRRLEGSTCVFFFLPQTEGPTWHRHWNRELKADVFKQL